MLSTHLRPISSTPPPAAPVRAIASSSPASVVPLPTGVSAPDAVALGCLIPSRHPQHRASRRTSHPPSLAAPASNALQYPTATRSPHNRPTACSPRIRTAPSPEHVSP